MNRNDICEATIGNLPWHEEHGCWGGFVELNGHSIPLTVIPSGQREPPIAFIQSLVAALRKHDGRLSQSAADELLDVYNGDWRFYTDDEVEVSTETFITRLSLKMLQIEFMRFNSRGQQGWGAVLTYDASDMFTEHDVSVYVHEDLSVAGVGLD